MTVVDKTEIVVDAQKKFVKNHIGRWVPLFCRMLAKKSDTGLFKLDCGLYVGVDGF
jgi:TorA maturation chaperone TorD